MHTYIWSVVRMWSRVCTLCIFPSNYTEWYFSYMRYTNRLHTISILGRQIGRSFMLYLMAINPNFMDWQRFWEDKMFMVEGYGWGLGHQNPSQNDPNLKAHWNPVYVCTPKIQIRFLRSLVTHLSNPLNLCCWVLTLNNTLTHAAVRITFCGTVMPMDPLNLPHWSIRVWTPNSPFSYAATLSTPTHTWVSSGHNFQLMASV